LNAQACRPVSASTTAMTPRISCNLMLRMRVLSSSRLA
jgi:hypothetical protein